MISSGPARDLSTNITVLTCRPGGLATKRWFLDRATGEPKKEVYKAGKFFSHTTITVANIHDLAQAVSALERQPDKFIIRAELTPEGALQTTGGSEVRRKSSPIDEGKDTGFIWFRDVQGGLPWVMFDFDKSDNPFNLDPVSDPQAVAEFLASFLPDCFHNVTYFWQLSASAGMVANGKLSGHLFYWFDRLLAAVSIRFYTAVRILAAIHQA